MIQEVRADIKIEWQIDALLVKRSPFGSADDIEASVIGEYSEVLYKISRPVGNVLWNRANDSTISIDSSRKAITIEASTLGGLFVTTYRAIRQILVWSLLNSGALALHASAACHNGVGNIFCGDKGAGKTTCLLQMLVGNPEASKLLGNDRVLVTSDGEKLFMHYWPRVAFVGIGSIASTVGLSQLQDIHRRAGGTAFLLTDHRLLTRNDCRRIQTEWNAGVRSSEKVWLTEREIAALTGASVCRVAPLNRVIWPKFDIATGSGNVQRVEHSARPDLLQGVNLTEGLAYSDWIGISRPLDREAKERNRQVWERLLSAEMLAVKGKSLIATLEGYSR